jgi:hypothetical protein
MNQTAKQSGYTRQERRFFASLIFVIILFSVIINIILHTL